MVVPNFPWPYTNKRKLQPSSFSSLKKSRLQQRKSVLALLCSFDLCAMHKAEKKLASFCTLLLLGLSICDCETSWIIMDRMQNRNVLFTLIKQPLFCFFINATCFQWTQSHNDWTMLKMHIVFNYHCSPPLKNLKCENIDSSTNLSGIVLAQSSIQFQILN